VAAERSRVRRLALLAAACAALAALAPASARADVQWRLASAHGPQDMPPGGRGQYVIDAYNVGDADTDGTPYTIVDTLPAGLTASAATGIGWSCAGVGSGVVTCSSTDHVFAPAANANRRGAAQPLQITVDVPSTAAGVADNAIAISGGSAGAAPATATDPTTFSSQPPAGTTPTGFGFVPGSVRADAFAAADPAAAVARQAGSHPFELRIDLAMTLGLGEDPDDVAFGDLFYSEPQEHLRTLEARLPAGLIGDPQATPRCDAIQLDSSGPSSKGSCPANTQVGTIDMLLQFGKQLAPVNGSTDVPIYNVTPPQGASVALGLILQGNPVLIIGSVDPSDRYAVIARIEGVPELVWIRSARLTLWGVPADPAHDPLRLEPVSGAMGTPFTGAPIRPFLTLPSRCDAGDAVQVRADSWQHPGVFTPWIDAIPGGPPAAATGCTDPRFRFQPTISAQPQARTPSTPTGLDVDLDVPQKDDAVQAASQLYAGSGDDRAIATPPLRDATVVLPAGMAISPSAADGLLACGPAQIGLGDDAAPSCPDASKVGTVSIATPLLPDPLTGSVYLAAQGDNPFGSLLAVYLVASAPGIVVKLAGQVTPDPVSGRLTVTFDDNPQLPFSRLHLELDGGPRAPLVTPATCGAETTSATLSSWNAALPAVQASDTFTISGDGNGAPCAARGFAPGFVAGTTNPVAGRDSPVIARFTRGDGDQELGRVDVALPRGLLGRLAQVDLCPDAAARVGTCGAGARIGTAIVGAGPGPDPFFIDDGAVYLTGPYEGAPFGLSIVVHALAGPFDLGTVIVRGQVQVDRTTAALRVVSDPLPTILDGIPLQLRVAQVTVDRPHFTFNPTNCAPTHATARISSTSGTVATRRSRFQVGDCAALPFHPGLSVTVGRRGHTGRHHSTPLVATVRMAAGEANLRAVSVSLPDVLTGLLSVVDRACTRAQFDAGRCAQARIGSAVADTPLLRRPLRGTAYFVKVPGARPGALPNLMIALRGQVDVDLVGKIAIPGGTRLAAHFDGVPDVPIRSFTLRLVDGRNGVVGIATSLCTPAARAARIQFALRAQSGRLVRGSRPLAIGGCPRRR
jgi:hypothetical protein